MDAEDRRIGLLTVGFLGYPYWLFGRQDLYITLLYFLSLSCSPSLLTQRLVYTLNTYVPLIVIDHECSLELYPQSIGLAPLHRKSKIALC